MALLSVNINKFALIRNARGTNHPDLLDISRKCLCFGARTGQEVVARERLWCLAAPGGADVEAVRR